MLSGKRILLTGANGGIGVSICETFLENNANLVLLYHKKRENIDLLLKKYSKYNSKIEIYEVDLLDDSQLKKITDKIISNGNIDAIIHSVTLPIEHKNILQKNWLNYQAHIELQTKSFFNLIQFLVPSMKNRKQGRIINILTSYVIGRPPTGISDYIVGKYSLLGLSKSLAVELGPFNINVNCISPSMIDSPLNEKLPKKLKEIHISQTPLGRLGDVADVSSMALFLCSKHSNYVSGENIVISGAGTMY
jgi:3-oxoacyl-[acyl-carrier protein] reductase